MRKLIAIEYVSLDGVTQAPGHAGEDPDGDFAHGGWTGPFMDDHRRYMSEVVGLPPEFVAGARSQPFWASQEAIAHTLAYDASIMDDYRLRADEFAGVQTPTLVLIGGASFPWMATSARELADALPHARRATLEGQQHNVDANALAPVVAEFLASG